MKGQGKCVPLIRAPTYQEYTVMITCLKSAVKTFVRRRLVNTSPALPNK